MPSRLTIPLTILLSCGVLAAQAWAASTRGVGLHDDYITFTTSSAPHGTITFNVNNHGLNTHTFNNQARQHRPGALPERPDRVRRPHLRDKDPASRQVPDLLHDPRRHVQDLHSHLTGA